MNVNEYKRLSETEHILQRPDTYVGSNRLQTERMYVIDLDEDGRWVGVKREVNWCPAFYKVIDEVLTNASDHVQREGSGVTRIEFECDEKTGRISVYNDGSGIPVVHHPTERSADGSPIWIPELIFGYLRTGSNYDDSVSRYGAGRNGFGIKLLNVHSELFEIECEDGAKKYRQRFSSNMSVREEPVITKSKKSGTRVSFVPDFSRFEIDRLDEDHMALFRRRLADISVFSGVKVFLNGQAIPVKSFKDYAQSFRPDAIYERLDEYWEFAITNSQDFEHLSMVNGTVTGAGGTHVEWLMSKITDEVRTVIERKNKGAKVRPSDIKNKCELFLNFRMANPEFNNQSKERLSCSPAQLPSRPELSKRLISKICDSEIVKSVMDWLDQKRVAEERAAVREANRTLDRVSVLKLVDAQSKDRDKCTLAIFEGDCVSEDTLVRAVRDGESVVLRARELVAGDYVLTHAHGLRAVKSVTRKTKLAFVLKAGGVEETCSDTHRWYVHDSDTGAFGWKETGKLVPGRHSVAQSRLSTLGGLATPDVKIQGGEYVVRCDAGEVECSASHSFAALRHEDLRFTMVRADDMSAGDYSLALTEEGF